MFTRSFNKNNILIDVRSEEEFRRFSIAKENVPIITKDLHKKLKKAYPLAIPIIAYGLYKDRDNIRKNIIKYKGKEIVFMCSRGRLRSPFMHMYAKCLGIKSKVLYGGVKKYEKSKQNIL